MTLLLQSLPLLLLLVLLGTGRAGPVGACLAALVAALPAVLVSLPAGGAALLGFLAEEAGRAGFLALQPVGVVTGGLLFHAAVAAEPADPARPRPATPARIFAVTLPMGAFLESVTGFAVGAVFALTALRGMGLGGAAAAALSLQALVLVPWGGLGPGTALGAVLAGVPAQEVALVTAWPNAAWLVALAPLLWSLSARAGVPVPPRERAAQAAMLGLLALLLVLGNRFLPFEVVGILATAPVLGWALWRSDPPRDARRALAAAAPYLALTACLLLARLWPGAPALRPYADLPAFPLTHVAIVLWLVAGALLLLRHGARGAASGRAIGALRRAARPAVAMLLYVLLGRLVAGSGAAAALAEAAASALGPVAPYAVAPLGLVAGMVTGSNVGANAALAALQAALGAEAGLPAALAPGVHNFAGAAGAGMSVGVTAMICGLLADGTRPGQVWRLLLPSMAMVVLFGAGAVALLR